MSIFYIVGKPRGGKSFMAVKAICQELADKSSKRFIVTNLSLKFDDYEREETVWPKPWEKWLWWLSCGFLRGVPRPAPRKVKRWAKGLKSWCAENAPHVENLRQRIRILEDDQTGEFWLYEPGWEFAKRKTIKLNRRGSEIDVPDFTYEDGTMRGDTNKDNPGTLYVIDEIHIFFPARAWQKTGEDATFFLSQHGKLKADVIMVTQHPEQCDKALRRLAQEYMSVRNLSREPVMGFRIGNLFRINRMLNSPGSPNPYVFDSQFIGMDFRTFGDLYDTSAGVGVAGSLVPNSEKRGRSLLWLVIPIVGFFYLLLHPSVIVKPINAMSASMMHRMGAAVLGDDAMKPRTNSPTVGIGQRFLMGTSSAPAATTSAPGSTVPDASAVNVDTKIGDWQHEKRITAGYCNLNGNWIVCLSDGRTAESRFGEVQSVERHWVKVFGQTFPVGLVKDVEKQEGQFSQAEPIRFPVPPPVQVVTPR